MDLRASDSWETLIEAGLPDGAPRPKPRGSLADERVREALRETVRDLPRLERRRREPLLAWLAAFEHHWPSRFERTLGSAGRDSLAYLQGLDVDDNKYLKLRRIAIDHLAGLI